MSRRSHRTNSKRNDSLAPIGVFGGTFDPVHFGHLRSALELLEQLPLATIRFIPCRQPPHRDAPLASPEQRLALLRLALVGEARFILDDRELIRPGPSYMVDTLASLRTEHKETPLCLILGSDAFGGLTLWHRWAELIELAHLLIMKRPGEPLPQEARLEELLEARCIRYPAQLRQQAAGFILPVEITQLAISATQIRALIKAGQSPRYLLPDAVWGYIQEKGLYFQNLRVWEE